MQPVIVTWLQGVSDVDYWVRRTQPAEPDPSLGVRIDVCTV